MGEVYAAYDPSLDRVVAVKTIRAESDDAQHAERFRREGRAAARLRHPLIVTVYELGEADGRLYMAMEYLEGESLAAAARGNRLTASQKLKVVAWLLDGLEHAHAQGVVHRDVKPSNVQLLPGGGLKVLDFGIARLMQADSLSHTGMVLGTVPYMSPEQLRGERVDHRADIYAAGVVAYELFTGRRPFDGETLTAIVLKVINDPPPPMDPFSTSEYAGLEAVLARALEKRADDRYASAAEMAAAVRSLVQPARVSAVPASTTFRVDRLVSHPPQPVEPPPVVPPPVPRRSSRAVGATVALAVLALAGALVTRHRVAAPVLATANVPSRAAPAGVPAASAPAGAAPSPAPAPSATPAPRLTGHAPLVRALIAQLRQRGRRLRAGEALDARLDVSLRRAPFAGSSAVTADFTASVVITRAGRAGRRCDASGHALEFSDDSARAAAATRAAEDLADCLAGAGVS